MSSSKLFFLSNEAHLKSGVRLLLELHCVIVIKHAFFTICENLLPFLPFFWILTSDLRRASLKTTPCDVGSLLKDLVYYY